MRGVYVHMCRGRDGVLVSSENQKKFLSQSLYGKKFHGIEMIPEQFCIGHVSIGGYRVLYWGSHLSRNSRPGMTQLQVEI